MNEQEILERLTRLEKALLNPGFAGIKVESNLVRIWHPTSIKGNLSVDGAIHPGWVYLTAPLTSTAWDGDPRSTTNWTLLNLSAVFGVPAGAKAVLVRTAVNDSGSASLVTPCYFVLSPTNTGQFPYANTITGRPNDLAQGVLAPVPCDPNGNIYYGLLASGAGTMDVWMEIWGYLH